MKHGLHKEIQTLDSMAEKQQTIASAPASLRSEILLVLGLVLSVFLLTSAGFDASEGTYDYRIAHLILTQGALGFATPAEGMFEDGGCTYLAPNGRTYAYHEFGNALFLLPAAAVNIVLEKALTNHLDQRRMGFVTGFTASLMPVIYCALTIVLFYAMLRISFRKSIATALTASMALAFCTFVWTYSRNLYDGVLCMCILTGAILSLLQFRRTMKLKFFLIAMALGGLGVVTRLTMALVLPAFLVYLTMVFWKDRKRLIQLVLIGITVLIPFAAWQTYYNHLRTGHWLIAPVMSDQYASTSGLTGDPVSGMIGLLFMPGKSIFLFIPLALLSIICFRRFMTSYPMEATLAALLSGMWLLIHAKLAADWYGAWGWGPRHFITIAPVLALPACVCWEWMKESWWRRILLVGALTWGAVLTVSSIIGNWHFRMALGDAEGRHDAMLWSLSDGQPIDMIKGALSNLRNIALHLPGPYLNTYSPINRYASNTVNVWINSAAYAGVPKLLLGAVTLALLAIASYCLIALLRIIRKSPEMELLSPHEA
jgi:4-amino-4-deoxy-L-arabinose transferase-like glycosyltransferase